MVRKSKEQDVDDVDIDDRWSRVQERTMDFKESRTSFSDVLKEVLGGSNWFRVPRAFLRSLKADQAVMLAYLLHESSLHVIKSPDRSQWFYATTKRTEWYTGFNEYSQGRVLKLLADAGCVRVCRRGLPSKRYVKINLKQVCKLIQLDIDERRQAREEHNRQRMESGLAADQNWEAPE